MAKPAPCSATALRMILAWQLQALRESAGMSYEQAAAATPAILDAIAKEHSHEKTQPSDS